MIRKWLIEARKKPKHVRDNIAMVGASSVTAAIFVVWLFTAPGQLEKEQQKTAEQPQAFSTFFGQIKEQVASVRGSLPEVPATTSESAQGAPVVLDASSTHWALSSSTVEEKRIEKEVPIIVVPTASSAATSTAPSAL